MKLSPTRILEEQLTQHGFLRIAGVDEAGCGALAGPVVAGAVILGDDPLTGLRDSKLMKEDERESLFDHLIGHVQAWGVGVVNAREIETIGIRPATYLAMRRYFYDLERRWPDAPFWTARQSDQIPVQPHQVHFGQSATGQELT